MKENVQSLFSGSKRFTSFILSQMNTGRAIGVLLLAVIAIAFAFSNPQRTSSASLKNTKTGGLPVLPVQEPSPSPACEAVPLESCSTDSVTGDRTCRFQTTSCQAFDNPCGGEPVLALVTTTLVIHSHTDRHGGRHFRSHLEMHGKSVTPAECDSSTVGVIKGNKRISGKDFALVKASTNQVGEIVTLVKESGFNASGPPPETFSDPLTVHVITTDGTPNFTLHLTLHATENANGELSSCISHERTSCPEPSN